MPQATTYKYDELSAEAQERAREQFLDDYDSSDEVSELFDNDLENWGLAGITVYWRLSHLQSDTVGFSGHLDLDELIGAKESAGLGGDDASYYDTAEYTRVCELVKEMRDMGAGVSATLMYDSQSGGTRVHTQYGFDEYDDLAVNQKNEELQEALTGLVRDVLVPRFMKTGYDQIEFLESEEEVATKLRERAYVFDADGERAMGMPEPKMRLSL